MASLWLLLCFVLLFAFTHAICENEVFMWRGPNERSMAANISMIRSRVFVKVYE
jgi:hypothetical protein